MRRVTESIDTDRCRLQPLRGADRADVAALYRDAKTWTHHLVGAAVADISKS